MKSFAAHVDIQAPTEKVWSILTDLPNWPRWNTTVERTVGAVRRIRTVFEAGGAERVKSEAHLPQRMQHAQAHRI